MGQDAWRHGNEEHELPRPQFCIRQVGRPAEAHVTGVEFAQWRLQSMLFCAHTEISTRNAHTGCTGCPYQSILMKKPSRQNIHEISMNKINKERVLLTRIRLQGSFLWTNHQDSFNTNCFNCHQLSTSKLAFNHQKKDKWWYTYVQYRWWFPSFFPGFQVPRTLHLSWGCNNYVTNMVTRA